MLNRADYNYQHEPFLYGWNKTHKFYGKGKFKNTSVWKIDRPTKSKEHPTMKPVELFAEILNNATENGDVVLDTFSVVAQHSSLVNSWGENAEQWNLTRSIAM